MSEYVRYFLEVRSHKGLGNVLLPRPAGESIDGATEFDDATPPPISLADINCEARLGGLLKHFYRQAAYVGSVINKLTARNVRAVAAIATGYHSSSRPLTQLSITVVAQLR